MRRTSAYRGLARTIDSLACQALRATIWGAPTEAMRRKGTRDTGLLIVSARTRVTLPLVRTWTATALPTQTGALLRHGPARRLSTLPTSGPSCSSSRAVHHADQLPAPARVRTSTRPGPRQCTPTSWNGRVPPVALKVRSPPSATSRT